MSDNEFQTSTSSVLDATEKAAPDSGDGMWVGKVTDKVLAEFPDQALYTCAAGISPSGIVHFGNFRDVITAYAVACELEARGKKARLLFSWDNYDRLRKVPLGVDPAFARYIGMPLTDVPDPEGKFSSYARRFEVEFEEGMKELGIALDYRYQTQEYKSGRYRPRDGAEAFGGITPDINQELLLRAKQQPLGVTYQKNGHSVPL